MHFFTQVRERKSMTEFGYSSPSWGAISPEHLLKSMTFWPAGQNIGPRWEDFSAQGSASALGASWPGSTFASSRRLRAFTPLPPSPRDRWRHPRLGEEAPRLRAARRLEENHWRPSRNRLVPQGRHSAAARGGRDRGSVGSAVGRLERSSNDISIQSGKKVRKRRWHCWGACLAPVTSVDIKVGE